MPEKITFELGAVLPTGQYQNVQPKVTVVADTFEEARDLALKQIQSVSEMVGSSIPIRFDNAETTAPTANALTTKVCAFTGTEVFMDEANHVYYDKNGVVYTSGSKFADKYKAGFDKEMISNKFAAKYGVEQSDVLAMWSTNAEASTSLGTAIHVALELYGKYLNLSMATKGTNESALHKNQLLAPIVQSFYAGREHEKALYEAFIANEEKHLCGEMDRVLMVDEKNKIVRIQDFKTNPDITKKATILAPFKTVVDNTSLGAYWLQLSFYAYNLIRAGWTVEGLDIFHYANNKWTTYSHDVIDLGNVL